MSLVMALNLPTLIVPEVSAQTEPTHATVAQANAAATQAQATEEHPRPGLVRGRRQKRDNR